MQDSGLIRTGAVFAIVGTIIGAIGNVLHPRDVDYDSIIDSTILAVAESPRWVAIHLALVVAVVLSVMGLGALSRSIRGPGSGLGRLAYIAVLIGGTGLAINLALDGVGTWTAVNAGESLTAATLITANNALFAINVVIFFGIGFLFLGLAVAFSDNYPAILGWVAFLAGGLNIVIGGMMSIDGQTLTTTNGFLVGSLVTTVWLFVMAILMLRDTRPQSAS